MQVELLMPDRLKVRDQTKRDIGIYAARVVEVGFQDKSAYQRTSNGVTPEEEPTSYKKNRLRSAQSERPDTGPTVCQGRGIRSNEIPGTRGN